MANPAPLETQLADIFEKKAPQMPEGGKKFFVGIAPWAVLIGGILTLFSALSLWHWAHAVNSLSDLCNSFRAYNNSATDCGTTRLGFWIWLTLLIIVVQAVLYLMAFPGLRDRKKAGWNYIYYAALVSAVYAIVQLFNGYNGVGGFVFSLIGMAIGFWILFQIRGRYSEVGVKPAGKAPVAPVKK